MEKHKNKSRSNLTFGIFLVLIGGIWLLNKLDIKINLPNINWNIILEPLGNFFQNFGDIIFSWPMFLLFIGLIMMAQKKKMGPALAIVGAIFLIPLIFSIHTISSSLILPVLLVAIGITILLHHMNKNESKVEQ